MYYSCAIDPNQMFSIIVFVTRTINYSKTQHRLFVKQQCRPYVPIKRNANRYWANTSNKLTVSHNLSTRKHTNNWLVSFRSFLLTERLHYYKNYFIK